MKRLIILLIIMPMLLICVNAQELEAPTVPPEASQYMPYENQTFGQGLIYIITEAIKSLMPALSEGIRIGLLLLTAALAMTYLNNLHGSIKYAADMSCVLFSGIVLLNSAKSMISLGIDTIRQMDAYGKLLLPVMTTALATEGGVTKSAALYGGTAIFSSLLTSIVTNVFIPALYVYIALCVADRVLGDGVLSSIKGFIKWSMSWILKLILYVFTGFIAVSGVVSGSADAVALRATKVTVSGVIPVVGGIISEASEAILVGAGVMKNAAGIYGLFAFLAICVSPVFRILLHSMILKVTSALCTMFGPKIHCGLIDDFTQAMNLVLGATGAVCLLLLISIVAFMKGVQ